MPGAGTRPATTRADAPARVLDVTRTLNRAGRTPTGIDRVEAAYIQWLAADAAPVFGLARTRLGYLLVDRAGLRALASGMVEGFAGRVGWMARLGRRGAPMAMLRAETLLREMAVARALPGGLARMIARYVPPGSVYVNVGHGWPDRSRLAALKSRAGLRVALMIHDVIPLTHPQHQRPGMPERFRDRIAAAAACADLVIHPAAATRARTDEALRAAGRVPEGLVAPPGVTPMPPAPLPDIVDPGRPYVLAVGTIEPRKRIDVLLDAWDLMAWSGEADGLPQLLLVGARGWSNAPVFRRLDRLLPDDPVRELGPLPDAALAGLLAGARAVLFPSDVEGFGLPPVEAAAMGVPVLCRDLPVYRETLGPCPRRVESDDPAAWRDAVEDLLANPPPRVPRAAPDWPAHFNAVLNRL